MNHSHRQHRIVISILWALLSGDPETWAETLTIKSTQDTTLHEVFPGNNFGAFTHIAAGATGSARSTGQGFSVTRGLFRFDLAGQIPATAKITSAKLTLRVTFSPGAAQNSTFELRRVLQAWGEGNKKNDSGNTGQPASANEATWMMRMAPATAWSKPGGAAPTDFSATVSATSPVGGVGSYTFGSNTNLVADVQSWVTNPNANFGWILISQGEALPQTARRFGAREDAANAPTLVIEYSAVQATELRVTSIVRQGNNIVLSWTGGTAPYQLQWKSKLEDAVWTNVGAASSATTATVPMDKAQAIFRITSG